MAQRTVACCFVVLVGLAHAGLAGAKPPERPTAARGSSRPSRTPASTRSAAEFRFDALRIDAELHGPALLEVRALARSSRAPLLRLHRSFVNRIFENVEAPALHGR